jgi:hypothetical protein
MDETQLRQCLRFFARALKAHQLAIQELRAKNRALIDLLEKIQPGFAQGIEATKKRLDEGPDREPYRPQFQQLLSDLEDMLREMGQDDGPMN